MDARGQRVQVSPGQRVQMSPVRPTTRSTSNRHSFSLARVTRFKKIMIIIITIHLIKYMFYLPRGREFRT